MNAGRAARVSHEGDRLTPFNPVADADQKSAVVSVPRRNSRSRAEPPQVAVPAVPSRHSNDAVGRAPNRDSHGAGDINTG